MRKCPVVFNSVMAKHEDKFCPRCGTGFECKVGTILQCQCSGLSFTDEEKAHIAQSYKDCLCRSCLTVIKHELHILKIKQISLGR